MCDGQVSTGARLLHLRGPGGYGVCLLRGRAGLALTVQLRFLHLRGERRRGGLLAVQPAGLHRRALSRRNVGPDVHGRARLGGDGRLSAVPGVHRREMRCLSTGDRRGPLSAVRPELWTAHGRRHLRCLEGDRLLRRLYGSVDLRRRRHGRRVWLPARLRQHALRIGSDLRRVVWSVQDLRGVPRWDLLSAELRREAVRAGRLRWVVRRLQRCTAVSGWPLHAERLHRLWRGRAGLRLLGLRSGRTMLPGRAQLHLERPVVSASVQMLSRVLILPPGGSGLTSAS